MLIEVKRSFSVLSEHRKQSYIHPFCTNLLPVYMGEAGGKKSKVYFFGELLAAFLMDANILFPLASMDVHIVHVNLSCQ